MRQASNWTSELNDVLLPIIDHYPPPAWKGKQKIKYITQIQALMPTFAFFCNLPQYIRDPYKRFLENQLREHYDPGVPVCFSGRNNFCLLPLRVGQ